MKISKTKFMAGVQCLKRLYLLVHEPKLAAQANGAAEAIVEQGHEVGVLARQLFPGGVEVKGESLEDVIHITKELLSNSEVPAIFEGTFEHQNVIVKTDILQRRTENQWRLVEVKSTAALKDHHVDDLAIQKWVVTGCGVNLSSVWLAHINREYVLAGATVDPRQFFLFRNLTARAKNLQPELVLRLRSQFQILAGSTPPEISTGPHCLNPVVCEFFFRCNRPKPEDYIGYLPRLHASAVEQLEEIGVESIHDIPDDFELSDIQRRACTAVQTGQPWFSPELKVEFASLKYPLHFMDFETVNPAIPRFLGMHPYDHLPFQWSVHVQREPDSAPEHFEFLAMDGGDPRKGFMSSLSEALVFRDGNAIDTRIGPFYCNRKGQVGLVVAAWNGSQWVQMISPGTPDQPKQDKFVELVHTIQQDRTFDPHPIDLSRETYSDHRLQELEDILKDIQARRDFDW
jgi:hypothetical protein